MLQIGTLSVIFAIHQLWIGNYPGGLFCLFAGLYFISTRKVRLDKKITLANVMTPVDDSDSSSLLDKIMRMFAYLSLAGAVALWFAGVLARVQ